MVYHVGHHVAHEKYPTNHQGTTMAFMDLVLHTVRNVDCDKGISAYKCSVHLKISSLLGKKWIGFPMTYQIKDNWFLFPMPLSFMKSKGLKRYTYFKRCLLDRQLRRPNWRTVVLLTIGQSHHEGPSLVLSQVLFSLLPYALGTWTMLFGSLSYIIFTQYKPNNLVRTYQKPYSQNNYQNYNKKTSTSSHFLKEQVEAFTEVQHQNPKDYSIYFINRYVRFL